VFISSENQVATPRSTTTEVVIPCKYIGFICGTNGSDLAEIKKVLTLFFIVYLTSD
jgi:poly(rC)-binding protein 2/3/4